MKEIRALTGIRGIAALAVFLDHTISTLMVRGVNNIDIPTIPHRILLQGGRQVDVFFVLSGLILAMIYANWFDSGVKGESYWKFLRRRLARIYPLHLVMVLLVGGFTLMATLMHAEMVHGGDRFNLATLPPTLLLMHAWGFAGENGGPWNPPSWSISIEFLAYLVLPFFLWGLADSRRKHPWLLVFGLLVLGFGMNAFISWGLAGIPGMVRGLCEFALGCSLAGLQNSRVTTWLRTPAGAALCLATLVVCYALVADTGFIIAVCVAPMLLCLGGKNWLSDFMGWTPVYFLGEISYSIYLGHFLFTSICYRFISIEWMNSSVLAAITGIALITAVVIGTSTATYYLIEKPGRDWLADRRKAPQASPSLAA